MRELYGIRKRLTEKQLLKFKELIENEINRRVNAETVNQQSTGKQ